MAGIVHIVALGVLGLSALLLLPVLVAAGELNTSLSASMLFFAILCAFFSFVILFAISGLNQNLSRVHSFVALILLWLVTAFVAALSFVVFEDITFTMAWFEAVSALTTSGGSIIVKQASSMTIIIWRATLEWYGGFLTLISILHILAPGEFGGLIASDRHLRPRQGQRTWFPNAAGYQRLVVEYFLLTIFIACCLILSGVNSLYSISLAMVAIATGGFVPFDGGLDLHVSRIGQLVLIAGLLIGTLNVFWRRSVLRAPRSFFQKNLELHYIAIGLGFLSLIYASQFAALAGTQASLANSVDYFIEGLFIATSLLATSGFETRPGAIAVLPDILVLTVILVGASIYSTTGGLKIYRIAMMARHAGRELRKLIYPASLKKLRFGDVAIDPTKMSAIWSNFILSIMCVATGALMVSTFGFNFEAAMTLSIALFSNAVPVYDALIPPLANINGGNDGWIAIQASQTASYYAFTCLMLIGRLEVILIFAVFNLRYWMSR